MTQALIGGAGLWAIFALALEVVAKSPRYAPAIPLWFEEHPIRWHVSTLALSVVIGGALALAQSMIRTPNRRRVLSIGVTMWVFAITPVLAAGLFSGMFTDTVVRAAVLFLSIVGGSVLVSALGRWMTPGPGAG
jgi:hypothetical protein